MKSTKTHGSQTGAGKKKRLIGLHIIKAKNYRENNYFALSFVKAEICMVEIIFETIYIYKCFYCLAS